MTAKEEFPPLLRPGFYVHSLADIRALCVTPFPLSRTRLKIMDGLERFVALVSANRIVTDIWVNGSFLTKKIDPDDVDLVLCAEGGAYEQGTNEQKELLNRIGAEDFKPEYCCDAYVFYEYPDADPLHAQGVWDHAYWIRQFGFSRGLHYKGLAVLQLR